jgi:LCP family protein required for cell wall assembly
VPYSDRPGDSDFPLTRNTPTTHREAIATAPVRINSLRAEAQRRSSKWTMTKRALTAMFCLLCVMAGTVVGSFYWKSDFARLFIDNLVRHPFTNPMDEWTPQKQLPPDKQHIVTILLLGCDKDYDPRRPIPIKDSRGRSDAILLTRVDFDNKTIRALSIPRDTAVEIPRHRGIHKINAAHAYGGPELTRETIRATFGIETDYYATLDFDGFQRVVDALGGIEINVQKAMKYDDNWGNLHIDLKPGFQKLNGYKAMGFVRMRHDDSDMARAERQQQFLEALRDKVKDPSNFMSLSQVLSEIEKSIQTNMTREQMLALGNFARSVPRENLQLGTLPVTPGRSFVYANATEGEELIRTLLYPDGLTPVQIKAPSRTQIADKRGENRRKNRRNQKPTKTTTPANSEETTEQTGVPNDETSPIPEPVSSEGSKPPTDPNGKTDSGHSGGEGSGGTGGVDGIQTEV